jgi:uncharacterized protein YlxW (UPF0749 family)
MIGKLVDLVWRQLLLTQDMRRSQADIKELRQAVRRLDKSVERLASEIEFIKATERLEREKLMLVLKNALGEFDRRLPSRLDN